MNGKKSPLKIIIIVTIIAVLAIAFGVTSYVFSPDQRARRALAVGEEYLIGLDYDQAFGKFREAVDIAPSNGEIKETIRVHIKELLTAATDARDKSDYDGAIEWYDVVIDHGKSFDEELVAEAETGKKDTERTKKRKQTLEKADKDFTDGLYEEAIVFYDEAIELGAEDDEVSPNRELCEIYQKIIELRDRGDWMEAGRLIDSAEFDPVINELRNADVIIGGDGSIRLMTADGTVILISGSLSEDGSGSAVAFISAANTYSLYDGEWKNYRPDGSGRLYVWNKNETIANAAVFTGIFIEGLCDGETVFSGGEEKDIPLSVSKGMIAVIKVDSQGRALVAKDSKGMIYAAVGEKPMIGNVINHYATVSQNVLVSYIAGVPGFGGGDKKLALEKADSEPPVLKCSLKKSTYKSSTYDGRTYYWPEGKEYQRSNMVGYGITATDNIDGDITDRIQNTSQKKKDKNGNGFEDWGGLLVVTYTVEDSAGNRSTMQVEYQHEESCDYHFWFVISVTYPEGQQESTD